MNPYYVEDLAEISAAEIAGQFQKRHPRYHIIDITKLHTTKGVIQPIVMLVQVVTLISYVRSARHISDQWRIYVNNLSLISQSALCQVQGG